MTRIFLYEHITAHGIGRDPKSPEHSLAVEGRAMLDAIREDFEAIPGVEVLMGEPDDFGKLAAKADWSFVIAPETDGVLLKLAEEVLRVGGRLLGPSPEAIALTSDKYALFQHWKSRGVPTPETVLCPALPPSFPCVLKRRDGAGSEGMRFIRSLDEYAALSGSGIAQPYCKGLPVGISFVIGPGGRFALLPTFQCISQDETFAYLGGLLPIAPELAQTAEMLGRWAIADVPGLLGYIGVDLLLGDMKGGYPGTVLEINPRMTTSYVGRRKHFRGNYAQQILRIAEGKEWDDFRHRRGRVAFSSAGKTRSYPCFPHWNDPSEISTDPTFFL